MIPEERNQASDPRQSFPPKRLLEANEVADLLAVPTTWVRTATRAGHLPHLRLGRYVRYELEAILEWAANRRAPG
jgi:excisionase family DNA binding protein